MDVSSNLNKGNIMMSTELFLGLWSTMLVKTSSVIARRGLKNVSLVESSGFKLEVQHGSHSHEQHFSVELLASVFLLTERWCSCMLFGPDLPQHLKKISRVFFYTGVWYSC